MRKYRSGTTWCVWRWSDVDSQYLTRLHLIKTPWFAVCLHWIHKPDPEPFDHDHPVSFVSLILRGGYQEWRSDISCRRRWINFFRADEADCHTIYEVDPNTLTLCFMGPKRREWGFHRPQGWIGWKAYYAEKRA